MRWSGTSILLAAAGLLLVVVCTAVGLLLQYERDARIRRRLASVRPTAEQSSEAATSGASLTDLVVTLGAFLARSGILPARTLSELENTLSTASLAGKNGLALFIGSKVLLALTMLLVSLAVVAHFSLPSKLHYFLPVFATVIGLVAPDYVVGQLRKRYLAAVARGVPDALDMMVICSEAGLGLEPAIARVGDELEQAHPEMARELRATAHEMQLMSDRRLVFVNMGDRTKLESLRRLGSTLIQTMQFGTPLTQALRTLASEMRQEQMTLYEGRAAKLPVMLTFPMILFILPCVFIVVGGPAALKVMGMLGKG